MISAARQRLDVWLLRAEERPFPWLAVLALLLAVQVSPLWYATPDGAAYLSIARRIAAGGPLARLGDPQLGFPLGYPLLISPAFLTGDRPFVLLSILHCLMAVVFMLGVYRWARQQIGAGALWITGLVMVNVNVWIHYRRTLSEAAFLAATIWTVNGLNEVLANVAERRGERARFPRRVEVAAPTDRPRSHARLLAAAVLLIALTMVREAGALFGAGFALALFAHVARGAVRWRAAALPLLVTAVAILAAAAVVRPERVAAAGPVFAGHLVGYADAAEAISSTFSDRLHLRATEIGQLLVPGMFNAYGRSWLDINTLVYVPLLVLVVLGWWTLVRRAGDVFAWTAPLYLGLHLAWPYSAGTRYLLPLLPLLFACLWCACAPLRPSRRMVFACLLAAHLGVAAGYWLTIDRPRARACESKWPALEHLSAGLRPDSGPVLAADVPVCVALMLELALDRQVQLAAGRPAVAATVHWIMAPDSAPPFVGFAPAASAGGYTLLHRQEAQATRVPGPAPPPADREPRTTRGDGA